MMGLGKSIQLIALILSNPFTAPPMAPPGVDMDTGMESEVDTSSVGPSQPGHAATGSGQQEMEQDADRGVFCYCGGGEEGPKVCCVVCHTIQHVACAGFDAALELEYKSDP